MRILVKIHKGGHATKKILIIDDEKYALALIEEYVKDEGFQALTVRTGQEAIKTFEQENPDLIIMDIQMPGTDTLGLLRKIKEKRRMLPVITHTGFDYRPELADWKNETNAFVVKSADLDELISKSKNCLLSMYITRSGR
ncbi:MAG: response regulator [Dissulfurispiraceae bacterium]